MQAVTDDYDELLLALYGAARTRAGFEHFLRHLCRGFGAHLAALHAEDLDRGGGAVPLTAGVNPVEFADFAGRYAHDNLWMRLGAPVLLRDGLVASDALCAPRDIARSDYYRELLRPLEIEHSLGFLLEHQPDGRSAVLTLNRSRRAGPFEAGQLALARRLLPHLRNAFALLREFEGLRTDSDDARELFEPLSCAAAAVDRSGRVLWANAAARAMFAEAGPIARDREGLLRLATANDDAALRRALAEVVANPHATRRLAVRDTRRAVLATLSVLPWRRGDWLACDPTTPAALLVLHAATVTRLDAAARIGALLGTTPAESRLLEAFHATGDLGLATARLGLRPTTARAHLKSALRKSGARRQGRLLQLIALCLDAP